MIARTHIRRGGALVVSLVALVALGPWVGRDLRSQAAEPAPVAFLPPVQSDTGDQLPADLERADFNGDGYLDLAVVTTQGSGKATNFLLGDGAGHLLLDNTIFTPYATGIASGDFNNDGIRDLAFAQTSNKIATDGLCPGLSPGAVVLLGTGGAAPGFAFKTCVVASPSAYLNDLTAADFNGDGKLDLAVGDNGVRGLRVYLGVGDGTFQAALNAGGAMGVSITSPFLAADVNGDGRLDLLAHISNGGLGTFIGDGAGGLVFTASAVGTTALAVQSTRSVAFADVNNDGRTDVVGIASGATTTGLPLRNYLFASLGTGTGTYAFATAAYVLTGATTGRLETADFNKDGAKDVVALDEDGNLAYVFLGRGDGSFAAGPAIGVGLTPQYVATGDWNNDNWLDIAVVDRNAGNQSRTWVIQQVPGSGDATPPDVAITSPVSGSSLQGTVAVSATATDASGVARVEFYRDNVLIGTDSAAPYEITWDTTSTPNGPHGIVARAYDTLENSGASPAISIVVANADATPPTVSLTSPASGALLSGVVSLIATANDAQGISRVEFLAGDAVTATVTAAPYTFAWNTVGFPAGAYALTARAYDTSGNSATSAPANVTVDQPPSVTVPVIAPIEATSPNGASVTLTGSATDSDTGDTLSYVWALNGTTLGTTPSITTMFPVGVHVVVFRATDSHGVSAEAYVQVQIDDTTAPVLTVPASLTQEATGPQGAAVSFSVSATDIVDANPTIECDAVSGSTFPLGVTVVTCVATDFALNASAPASFNVTVQDTTGPSLSLPATVSAEATSAGGAAVTFVASALDLVDGARPVSCAPPSGSLFPLGTTAVTCASSDTRGNASNGGFSVIVRDTTPPVVQITTPPNGSQVSGVVTIAASAADNTSISQVTFYADAQVIGTAVAAPYGVSWDSSPFPSASPVTLRAIATDASGNTAETTAGVIVVHPDVLPPVVTPPAAITAAATEIAGARGNIATAPASQAVAAFIAGGSASDAVDPAPVRLPAQASIGGTVVDVDAGTLFPVGATEVSFRFRDASGNIGSAISVLTVDAPAGGVVSTPDVPVTATDSQNIPGPVSVTFVAITQPGLLTADVIVAPADLPVGLQFASAVYDVVTTALVGPSMTVCVQGSDFTAADRLLHFENGAWVDVTTAATPPVICGAVTSLSPFVVATSSNHAPTADAGPPQTVEATSSSGASVTLTGTGADPDLGDTLAFEWTEGAVAVANEATATITLAPGTHTLTLTVTDTHGASASASTTVLVQDTTAPTITLPSNQTVEATSAAGSAVSFVASGADAVDGSVPVTCTPGSGTTFPIATTTVSCSATDAARNTARSSFSITVRDTTAPIVSLTAPADGSTVNGLVAVSASASDLVGVAAVEFFAGGQSIGVDTTAPFGVTWDASALSTGSTVTLSAVAADAAGNHAVSPPRTVTSGGAGSDTVPPVVAVTSPANGSTVSGIVPVTASATDNTAVKRVEFYAGAVLIGVDTSAPYGATLDARLIPVGTRLTLTARAVDEAGNSTQASVGVVIGQPAGVPAEITSDAPSGQIVAGVLFTHQFAATGSQPLSWRLDFGPAGMTIDPATGLLSWTPTGAQAGTWSVLVRVSNGAGIDWQYFALKVVPPPPPAPSAFWLVSIVNNRPTVAWTPAAAGGGVAYYRVYEFDPRRGRWQEVSGRVSGATTTLDQERSGSIHVYAVRAFTASGTGSPLSPTLTVVIP